jgi:two-component SAPR family response regulator
MREVGAGADGVSAVTRATEQPDASVEHTEIGSEPNPPNGTVGTLAPDERTEATGVDWHRELTEHSASADRESDGRLDSAASTLELYHRPLDIRCFGPFTASRDGEEVREWERPAAREVLAYLAVVGWRGISSDQLLEALVPERDRESAAKILHPRLAFLRKAIREDKERPLIRFSAGQYRLDPDRVWVDVAAFDDVLARAKRLPEREQENLLAEAVDLYRGELFANDCPEWAVPYQEEYRAKVLDALNRAAACAARRGDHRTAVERYRRALALDPINEEVAANLARLSISSETEQACCAFVLP